MAEQQPKKASGGTEWLAIGLALGVVFGIVFDNLALLLPLGVCFGVCVAELRKKQKDNKNNHNDIDKE